MVSPYVMRLDLRVLDHLGIKLYSNAAAVLSEAVANAWDADAEVVEINMGDESVVIKDDGVGMTLDQINNRFLWVGYDKRSTEGEFSEKKRRFMGRKGIGKLALFSIADEIEVYTFRDGQKHAFRMKVEDLRAAIRENEEYFPESIPFEGLEQGTRIALHQLKKRRTTSSIAALRKRIARRFSVIGRTGSGLQRFEVRIDGESIGSAHREDLRQVEFLWEFGEETLGDDECPSLIRRFTLPAQVDETQPDWKVRGWLGAVSKPEQLKHEELGSLNSIVVLARGRLIQENILDKLNFNRILSSYLTGQVEADFLDLKDEDDIATSDRQRLVEDDHRYVALTRFLRSTLVSISDQWTDLRNEVRGKDAISEQPALEEWLKMLPQGQRDPARRLLGLVRGLELEDEDQRINLYKSGVVAFERLRLREETHRLVSAQRLTAEELLPLLSDLASLEGSLYTDIVRSRLDVIRRFEDLVDLDEKEKVLQEHLFENLWLLDPGWERAAGSERVERSLRTEYKDFDPNLSDKESMGRVDIRYRTNADQHMIVELKRAGRRLHLHELVQQGVKYRNALGKCLRASGVEDPHISVVFVVGKPVFEEEDAGGREVVIETLRGHGARVVQYEALIRQAQDAYSEYLEGSRSVSRIDGVLKGLSA